MSKLLATLAAAIAAIFGFKQATAALQSENSTLKGENEALKVKVSELQTALANDPDEAELAAAQERAEAAEAESKRVQAILDEAETKAGELAALLNENPETPSVDGNFNIVPNAPVEVADNGTGEPAMNPEAPGENAPTTTSEG